MINRCPRTGCEAQPVAITIARNPSTVVDVDASVPPAFVFRTNHIPCCCDAEYIVELAQESAIYVPAHIDSPRRAALVHGSAQLDVAAA